MVEPIAARVPVFLFIQNKSGDVYLQRRANTGYMDGRYDTPAGKIDPGESPQEAVCREAMEEAGLTVHPENLELFHAYYNATNARPWLGLMFRTEVWEGEPSICEPHKCDDAGFFALDALPEVTPQVRDALGVLSSACSIKLEYYTDLS
jgi:8-oxo-dGTP diphosphatase